MISSNWIDTWWHDTTCMQYSIDPYSILAAYIAKYPGTSSKGASAVAWLLLLRFNASTRARDSLGIEWETIWELYFEGQEEFTHRYTWWIAALCFPTTYLQSSNCNLEFKLTLSFFNFPMAYLLHALFQSIGTMETRSHFNLKLFNLIH